VKNWDEDDVMLFLWENSKAATERYTRKNQEREDLKVNRWRAGIVR